MSRNGAFVLACSSGNFNLAEHVLNVALTAVSPTSFLGGEPNNIVKALLFAVEAFDVSAALKVMNMCHKVIDKTPGIFFAVKSKMIESTRVATDLRVFSSQLCEDVHLMAEYSKLS